MKKYDEMQKLIKYLKIALGTQDRDSNAPRILNGDILKLVTLLVTDRVLHPGEYGSDYKNVPGCPEILERNQPLLKVFRDFFQEVYWDCLSMNQKQINLHLDKFNSRELLHVPGMVHQALLTMPVSAKITRRKYQGSYYTPIHIVRYMVDNALHQFAGPNNIEGLKIIDPACGGGSFLLEAWYALKVIGLPATKAASCIFGIDIDDIAVKLSIYVMTVAVWAESGRQLDVEVIKKD
ncbi:MAG: BREX-1 system adenine-specific DNA-methyltransferase PglX, partial [Firmicutes bacterium]|nr:BREX-1 system adenine-specific DNA-methyltransferase PglX [Bacillota bacterium]